VAIACDLHPDYASTRYAQTFDDIPVITVQHHFAHIAACMAEHKFNGPVIGLAFDGTGFGEDGAIWGGEVMVADFKGYERAAHLSYVPMPGSTFAIKQPWRMALSYLWDAFGERMFSLDLPLFNQIEINDAHVIIKMIHKQINAPFTSSMGRLFDGVASMLGLRQQVTFEGQAAMELEMIADTNPHGLYHREWNDQPMKNIRVAPLIRGVVEDITNKVPAFIISRKFHETLIVLFADLCETLRWERRINHVVLSGGVFQNTLLLKGLIRALTLRNFTVFSHGQVPTNDGGIALGQAIVAGSCIADVGIKR